MKNNKQPFYVFVPQWMIKLIEQKKCSQCDTPVIREYIQATGIREQEEGKNVFFVEHCCAHCNYTVCTNFNNEKAGSLEDLCYDMIEQANKCRELIIAKDMELNKKQKSKNICDTEMKKCINFLKKVKSHKDFLKYIGADNIILDTNED